MFFFKKIYFIQKTYTSFYENIVLAQKNNCAVLSIDVSSEVLKVMIIINKKALVLTKPKDYPLSIDTITFSDNVDRSKITKNIYELIMFSKKNAILIKNHNFIEKVSEIFIRIRNTYNLNLNQQHEIWKKIFLLDQYFFDDTLKIEIPKESIGNTWVD